MKKFASAVFLLFVFCPFVFSEENSTFGTSSEVLSPWIEVSGIEDGENICNDDLRQVDVSGAFYLNHGSLVDCQINEYTIKISVMQSKVGFDEELWHDEFVSSCNYWDIIEDPLAPFAVKFERQFSTAINNLFPLDSSQEEIYFRAKVMNDAGDFQFNFNEGHIVESDFYDFDFVECRDCLSGSCCVNLSVLPYGSQPEGIEDSYYCSGENSVFSSNTITKTDYYCDGVNEDYSAREVYSFDVCGSCEYCSSGNPTCSSYSSSTEFSLSDCDYLDAECRDYTDVENYCDGSGGISLTGCSVYTNLPSGTECSEGYCDGQGNCEECVSNSEYHCKNGDIYWWNSCGVREDLKEDCSYDCQNDVCVLPPSVECMENSDCGFLEDYFVCGSEVSRNYASVFLIKSYKQCIFPGTTSSYCLDQGIDVVYQETCDFSCRDGVCVDPECIVDADCGSSEMIEYCSDGDVWRRTNLPSCLNAGESYASCSAQVEENILESCSNGCENSSCIQMTTQYFDVSFDLNEGWNLISIPYVVENLSLPEVFGVCFSEISQIKGATKFYSSKIPTYLNTLENLERSKGYWVEIGSDCSFSVEGLEKEEVILEIKKGWNLISCPLNDSASPSEFFGSDFSSVLQIKDEKSFYSSKIPTYLNTLDEMVTGKGYWVESSSNFEMNF